MTHQNELLSEICRTQSAAPVQRFLAVDTASCSGSCNGNCSAVNNGMDYTQAFYA